MNVEPTILVVSAGDPDERLIAALQQHGLYVERIRLDSFSGMYPLVAPDLVLCFGARESSSVLRAMVEAELAAPSRLAIIADPGQVALTQGLNRRLVVAVLTTNVPSSTLAARLATIAFRLSERRATETRTRAKAGQAQVVRQQLAMGLPQAGAHPADHHAGASKLKALRSLTQAGGRLGPSSLRAPEPDISGLAGSGGFRPRPADRTRWLRGGKARRAVVADVNPERARAIADALTERGLDVQVVPLDPYKTDWARLQAHEPDVVLVDLPSVAGPGRVWLELLRADAQLGQVRVVELNLERVYDEVDDQVSLAALEPHIEELSSYRSEMPTIVAEDERPTLHLEEEERPTLVREESSFAAEQLRHGLSERIDEMPTVAHIDLSELSAAPSTLQGAGPGRTPQRVRGAPAGPGAVAPDGPPQVVLSDSVVFESQPHVESARSRTQRDERAVPPVVAPGERPQAPNARQALPPQPVAVAFPPVRPPRPSSSWPPRQPIEPAPPDRAHPVAPPVAADRAQGQPRPLLEDPWSDPPSESPGTWTGLARPRRSERSGRTISSWPPPPPAGSVAPGGPRLSQESGEAPPPSARTSSRLWPEFSSTGERAPASAPLDPHPVLPQAEVPQSGMPQSALPQSALPQSALPQSASPQGAVMPTQPGPSRAAAAQPVPVHLAVMPPQPGLSEPGLSESGPFRRDSQRSAKPSSAGRVPSVLAPEPKSSALLGVLKFLLAAIPILALAGLVVFRFAPHLVTQVTQKFNPRPIAAKPAKPASPKPSPLPAAPAAPVPEPAALANPWTLPATDALACEQVAEPPAEVTGITIERGAVSWDRARRVLVLGDLAAAHRHMCEAVFNNPQSLALEGLVAHYLALHAAPEALRWAQRALEVRGEGRKAGELFGDALSQLGRVEEARSAWLGALKIEVGDQKTATLVSVSYVGEAERALLSADLPRAESMARRAAGLDEASAAAAAMMASVFVAEGFEEQARLWITRCEQLDASEPGCLIARGEMLTATGRPGEARDLFRRVTQIAPSNKRGWLRLSRLPP